MFFKSRTLLSLASIIVLSTANPVPNTSPSNQCNTGPLQCCNSVTSASNPEAAGILKSIGVVVQGVDVLVGLGCTAITVVGVGQGACDAVTACCTNNNFEGVINIGCTPITV